MADHSTNPHARRHGFTLGLIRLAALAFVSFLIVAITIANTGNGEHFWPFIHQVRYADKAGHILLFGTLSFLCNLTFPSRRFGRLPRPLTATTFVLLILISLEEISQAFIPTRSCDIFDWLADLVGLAIGQIAACNFMRRFDPKTTF